MYENNEHFIFQLKVLQLTFPILARYGCNADSMPTKRLIYLKTMIALLWDSCVHVVEGVTIIAHNADSEKSAELIVVMDQRLVGDGYQKK